MYEFQLLQNPKVRIRVLFSECKNYCAEQYAENA